LPLDPRFRGGDDNVRIFVTFISAGLSRQPFGGRAAPRVIKS